MVYFTPRDTSVSRDDTTKRSATKFKIIVSYLNIKIVKTKAGNSILISLPNGEGWSLKSKTNDFKIEKNIFLGNKNKIINNEAVSISGTINEEIISIKWEIERVS